MKKKTSVDNVMLSIHFAHYMYLQLLASSAIFSCLFASGEAPLRLQHVLDRATARRGQALHLCGVHRAEPRRRQNRLECRLPAFRPPVTIRPDVDVDVDV